MQKQADAHYFNALFLLFFRYALQQNASSRANKTKEQAKHKHLAQSKKLQFAVALTSKIFAQLRYHQLRTRA